ncbi:MAG: right-handed parallel beta-helix repeat-containing protein [Promethearchaeota archaeon]
MKYKQKIILDIVILIILTLNITILALNITFDSLNSERKKEGIKASGGYGQTLNYRDFTEIKYTASNLYGIEWSFTSHNAQVGIKALAMDNLNYQKFMLNKSKIKYHLLSNGEKSHDQGCFAIPYENTWFIIFLNDDPDQESTEIDIDWDVTYNPVLFIIIPIILFAVVTSFYIVSYFIIKKRRKKFPLWSSAIYFILLFLSFFYLAYGYPLLYLFIEQYPRYPISSSSPLYIDSTDDFERYNIPGSGTLEDPYRIENRTICNGRNLAIDISYVSVYFIIQNNFLFAGGAIRIDHINVGYIKIINNTCVGTLYNTRGYGIDIYSTDGNFNISNNKVLNYQRGISLGHSPTSTLENNKLINNNLNLYISYSNSTRILNNTFTYKEDNYWSEDCIHIGSSYNCSIKNNILRGNGLYFSDYLGYSLICENNLVNGKDLGFIIDQSGLVIDNPEIYGQLFFINCSNIIIKNQNIENTNYAITFIDCKFCNCTFSNFSYNLVIGIRIINSNDFNVSNCQFNFNSEGAYLSNSNSTIFVNNIFYNNTIGILMINSECDYLANTFYNNTENWVIES